MRAATGWAALALVATPATAQQHSTRDEAGHILTQPGRDIGVMKTRIPPVLKRAAAPYGSADTGSCASIKSAMADLDDALGPDFGRSKTRRGSRIGTVARLGGTSVVNSLIPFRGVVREVSGAAAASRRLAAAVNAGYARRGYLRGLASAKGCGGL